MIPLKFGPLRTRFKSLMFRFYTKHFYYNMSFYSNTQMLALIVLAFIFLFMLDLKITQVERKNAILLRKTKAEQSTDIGQVEIKEDYPDEDLDDAKIPEKK